jgi:cytochrome c553
MRLIHTITIAALFTGLACAADVAAGKAAYEKSCKKCHGGDGTPNPAIAKMMKVEMKHLGSKEVQGKSDAVLKKETLEGVGKMKAIALSDAEATNVVAFMRTLKS